MRQNPWGLAYLAAAIAAGVWLGSCGGSSSPTQPTSTTIPSTSPSTTTLPTTPTVPASACSSLGRGDVDSQCSRKAPVFLPALEAAQDKLVRERPDVVDI